MSINTPQIGDTLEYWHNKKWQKAVILEKSEQEISIQIWISVVNPKLITMSWTEWKNLINENRIYAAKNKSFPSWVKISQLVIIHQQRGIYPKQTVAKIAKYIDGRYITLFYIKYPDASNDTMSVKTINMNLGNKSSITPKSKHIHFMDGDNRKIMFPYYNQVEMYNHYDMIADLNNNELIQSVWTKNNTTNTNKCCIQKVVPTKSIKKHSETPYITNSTLQYGFILDFELFPFDINRMIISYLAQKLIYICPPTPCNDRYLVAQSWQFNEKVRMVYDLKEKTKSVGVDYNKRAHIARAVRSGTYSLAVIGCEFEMKENLWISGFELNNIEMLQLHEHKIVLNEYMIATQVELPTVAVVQHEGISRSLAKYLYSSKAVNTRDAQFVFKNNKLVQLNKGIKYTVKIKVNANVPCYQYHEAPSNVKYFAMNNNNTIWGWKCFKYIRWRKFNDLKKYTKQSLVLQWFPHFALLLP